MRQFDVLIYASNMSYTQRQKQSISLIVFLNSAAEKVSKISACLIDKDLHPLISQM